MNLRCSVDLEFLESRIYILEFRIENLELRLDLESL